ncbi:MAG TPA: ABC transporter permease subunit [Acidimicrobiia bacterium]
MTTSAGSPARPPLWRNVRVLSWAFQLVVFALVAAVLLWLWGNYRENVASSGIPTDFGFLDNPANFEIPGNDFNQRQPVRDVYFEGFVNTLRVSVVGIVLATVLGTLIGIARLSTNWVVRRISTVYVEVIRNVPLLILLTFVFLGVVLQALPTIQAAWVPAGVMVLSNRGIGVPWYQDGSGYQLALLALVGLTGWWLIARWRTAASERTGTPSHAGLLGGGFFVAVTVIGWIALGFSLTTPEVTGRQITGGIRVDPSYFALLIALVVYTASHIAEIVRGSIQAVPRGQDEAAQALALSPFQRMWNVVLPQAMRIAIPPLGNQYLNLIKNSSLGAGFAYFELTNVTRVSVGNGSPAVPAFTLTLAIYVGLSLLTSLLVNIANRRFELVER